MNVLVTGGTGFIGAHVIRELLNAGHQAAAFDSLPNADSLRDVADKIEIVRGDVQDLPAILALIKNFSVTHVVHTASMLTKDSQEKPWTALNVNVLGTVNILEAARLMDLRKVTYMSSTAVYGITEEGQLIDEEYPQRPVTIYGATKLLCEHYGENYSRDYHVGFAALRFPIVYGPGQSYRGFSSFKEIVEKPLQRLPAKVPSGGDHKYDGIYVKDAAAAIIAASYSSHTDHTVFNIGTGVQHTLKDLARVVKKFLPDAVLDIGPGFDAAEPIKGPLNTTRAKEELGFEAKFDLESGVKDYIKTITEKLNEPKLSDEMLR